MSHAADITTAVIICEQLRLYTSEGFAYETVQPETDIAVLLFSVTIAAFIAFFLYMGTSEGVAVYRAEEARGYGTVTGVQTDLVSDSTAPIGVRKVYRWILEPEQVKGSSLLFNIAHHEIEVYFEDVLVYSLTGAEGNRIGRNVSSNWCFVYAGPERTGQTVTVVLTPCLKQLLARIRNFCLVPIIP